jgi:hypothetical protein
MVRCNSCEAALAITDRFCPACGTPNTGGKLHPKFGPRPEEPPGPPERPDSPPVGKPYCPRCWSVVDLADPFCMVCGMSLDEVREEAELAGYLDQWLAAGGRRGYRPLAVRRRVVTAILAVIGGVASAIAVASLASAGTSTPLLEPSRFDGADLSQWEGRAQLTMVVCATFGALAFVWWAARAYRNLPALGVRGLRFGARWATAMWFVPFVNLVLPKEVVDDLWRASDPDVAPLSTSWRLRTIPFRVHLWWISVLGAGLLIVVAQWVLPPPEATAGTASRVGLALVGLAHLAAAAGALLGTLLVHEVGNRQARRFQRLGLLRPFDRLDASLKEDDAAEEVDPGELLPRLAHADTSTVWGRY